MVVAVGVWVQKAEPFGCACRGRRRIALAAAAPAGYDRPTSELMLARGGELAAGSTTRTQKSPRVDDAAGEVVRIPRLLLSSAGVTV